MAIKWKNIKYSFVTKAVAVFLVWAAFIGLCASAVFLGQYGHQLLSENYYDTNKFKSEFSQYVYCAVDYAVTLRSEEHIRSGYTSALEKEPVDQPKQAAGELTVTVLEASGQVLSDDGEEPSSEETADDSDVQAAIERDVARFRELKRTLNSVVNFEYIVLNRDTGDVVTNMDSYKEAGLEKTISGLKAQSLYLHISENDRELSSAEMQYNFNDLIDRFNGTPFELHAAVKAPLSPGDVFYATGEEHGRARSLIPVFSIIAALSLLTGIAGFIYLTATAGRREEGGRVALSWIDSLYNDVHTMLVIIVAFIPLYVAVEFSQGVSNIATWAVTFILLSIVFLICLSYILSMARHIKNKSLRRHTLIYTAGSAVLRLVRLCFSSKTFKFTVLVFLLGYGALNSIFFLILVTAGGGPSFMAFLILVALNLASLYFVSKALISVSRLMEWTKELSKGNLDYSLDPRSMSPAFAGFAADIGNLQAGLRHAVSEAVKGERLKAELITNVSHDLKTPLTSIINYVDLLKKEKNENETVKGYIDILDEKSGRLKQLVEDLLEVSKAASGNISVSYEGIDLHSLVLQAVAEFGDRAAAAGLDIRIKTAEKASVIHGDGRLMWRILDNLLTNVVKYSQKNSRVYINIENSETHGIITIKNISEAPLDIPADQLLERFVRGEASRTAEGSGLGLSIAQSLAGLQGGRLDVSIDGDLFKVSVSVPLAGVS